jgi:hypothetical protein
MLRQENRRRWERYAFDASVRVVVDPLTDKAGIDGRGIKLGPGGMCLFAPVDVAIGAQIGVEFIDSRSREPVRVHATVRNRAVYLYGVEFLLEE